MPDPDHRAGLFPALLKHWRRQRGLSQLDLALAADVSARHVSFLETGRSRPSADMVVCLASSLGVPLRQANAMLRAAGHEPVYEESDSTLPAAVIEALALLKAHHEPFPLLIVDRTYRVLDLDRGALAVLGAVLDDPVPDGQVDVSGGAAHGLNLARLTFDPDGAQPRLVNFDQVGRQLLWRIQREVLADPDDGEIRDLLDELLAMPTSTRRGHPPLSLRLDRGPPPPSHRHHRPRRRSHPWGVANLNAPEHEGAGGQGPLVDGSHPRLAKIWHQWRATGRFGAIRTATSRDGRCPPGNDEAPGQGADLRSHQGTLRAPPTGFEPALPA